MDVIYSRTLLEQAMEKAEADAADWKDAAQGKGLPRFVTRALGGRNKSPRRKTSPSPRQSLKGWPSLDKLARKEQKERRKNGDKTVAQL